MAYRPELTAIDLFGGAGGTAWGLRAAGFRVLAAVDSDPNAAATYESNIGVHVITRDIRRVPAGELRRSLRLRRGALDVLTGCPPCQGFTRMRNGKGAGDPRNALVLRYLAFVREFFPRYAVFENVPGLVESRHGGLLYCRLIAGLRRLGYAVEEQVLDAVDFGVSQFRRRVIVIAGRRGYKPVFPTPTHAAPDSEEVLVGIKQPWATVRDAIGRGQYPRLKAGENGERNGRYPKHIAPRTGARVLTFLDRVPRNGGSRRDVPRRYWLECHVKHDGHRDVYGRLAWDFPANTITSGCTNPSKGRFVHPTQNRALTFREAALLQSFPDTFVFKGCWIDRQIGNAVPPLLAYAIFRTLYQSLVAARRRAATNGYGGTEH